MPNWCENTLTLEHQDPEMITRAKNAFAAGKFLAEFIPVPEELSEAKADFSTNEELVAKYGYSDWYGFCVNEWGTKWDVGNGDGINEVTPNSLVLYFDSAWSPPTAAYSTLVDLGFDVKATYNEPGIGFAGIWENGTDDLYEYSNLTAELAVEILPAELDEQYGISENLSEWEDQGEE